MYSVDFEDVIVMVHLSLSKERPRSVGKSMRTVVHLGRVEPTAQGGIGLSFEGVGWKEPMRNARSCLCTPRRVLWLSFETTLYCLQGIFEEMALEYKRGYGRDTACTLAWIG